MSRQARSSCGFSLIEVLVGVVLLLVLSTTVFGAYRFQMFALKGQEVQIDTQETARGMIELMTREVRQAGYDPSCAKTFDGVADARPQWLRVQFDSDGNGAIGANESVTYAYNSDSKEVDRTAAGTTVPLVTGVPASALVFTYYDGSGAVLTPGGTPPALTPSQRAAVRRIRIAIQVERPNPDPLNSRPLVSDLVSNVDLRNRFLNASVACP